LAAPIIQLVRLEVKSSLIYRNIQNAQKKTAKDNQRKFEFYQSIKSEIEQCSYFKRPVRPSFKSEIGFTSSADWFVGGVG